MNFIQQKLSNLRAQYHSSLTFVTFMVITVFLLSVFDSIISYLVPIVFVDSGLSEVQMGWLYASSSFFGLLFDVLLARYLTTTRYNKTLFYTLLIAILVPITLLVWPQPGIFLLGMALWGLYYNLWAFASADFSAREAKTSFHVASVSLLLFTHDIGYLTGTLSVEPLMSLLSRNQLLACLILLVFAAIGVFIPIYKKRVKATVLVEDATRAKSIRGELGLLFSVSRKLLPLLLLGVIVSTVDAITWTITPILDTIFPEIGKLGGVVLAINFLPSFFAYSLATPITAKFGKKRTGSLSFIFGTVALSFLGISGSVSAYLVISFIAAFFISVSYAAIGGAYADYLRESKSLDNEIVSTRDMSTNLGYILGPILGGILLGSIHSIILYTYLGITVSVLGLLIFLMMPTSISFTKT